MSDSDTATLGGKNGIFPKDPQVFGVFSKKTSQNYLVGGFNHFQPIWKNMLIKMDHIFQGK